MFHVHDRPAFLLFFVESLVKTANAGLAIVESFALCIGEMDVERKSPTHTSRGPLQYLQVYLQVAVGIAKCGDRASADVLTDRAAN